MSRRWEQRTDGRLCLVIDPEDGTHPQRVYGKDKDEILDKVAKTAEHSARHIAALKSQPPSSPATRPAPATAAPAARKTLTPDEQMQATADLQNPGKAPAAIRALLDDATGGAVSELEREARERRVTAAIERAARIAGEWAAKHPEFPRHPANKKMLMDAAALRVGLEGITEEVLQTVYLDLLNGEHLVEDRDDQEPTPVVQPGETPAPRTTGTREATTYRRTSLRAGQPSPAAPKQKYTRAEIDAMPADVLRRKMTSEPGFAALLDQYATTPQKTA